MTYRYRNANTGQVVEYAARSVRLDHLPNWALIDQPDPPASADQSDPVKPAEQGEPAEPVEQGDDVDQAPAEQDDAPPAERPAKRAPVAEWRAYAVARGERPEDVESMSKADLIELYGG